MEVINNKFALKLYHKIRMQGKNIFVSPYSILSLLMLVLLGTQGNSQKEIQHVLEITDFDAHSKHKKLAKLMKSMKSKKVTLDTVNKLFSAIGLEMNESYLQNLYEYYDAEPKFLNFAEKTEESRQYINKWVKNKTNDKIEELIPADGIDPKTLIVLVNAIYFKGDWEHEFDEKETKVKKFRVSKKKN